MKSKEGNDGTMPMINKTTLIGVQSEGKNRCSQDVSNRSWRDGKRNQPRVSIRVRK